MDTGFPLFLVTANQMQTLDRRTIQEEGTPGLTLMNRAGQGVVGAMEQFFGSLSGKVVTILCGKGNNGGDGLVVARLLRQKRARPRVMLFTSPADLSSDAKVMYQRWRNTSSRSHTRLRPSSSQIHQWTHSSNLLIDALLGTGLSSPVREPYVTAIQAMNGPNVPVIAVDLPSGINADNGTVMGTAVTATLTVTFGLPKLGLYLNQGINSAGTIVTVDIGIPCEYVQEIRSPYHLLSLEQTRSMLPPRRLNSHKGTYGHVAVIAGSIGKTGAAALSALSALRTGSGLVTVATSVSAQHTLEHKLLEVMTYPLPETSEGILGLQALDEILEFTQVRNVAAIGPGLGSHRDTFELVRQLIPRLTVRTALDADALNALADHTDVLRSATVPLILTPHPGEMARLVNASSPGEVNSDPLGIATRFAQTHGVVLLLKGARTIIAHPTGSVAICPTGNPGMATAGSGDVLTGMIASLLGQGCPAWDAACAGTYFHGLAGNLTANALGPRGMIARDLISSIPKALLHTERQDNRHLPYPEF